MNRKGFWALIEQSRAKTTIAEEQCKFLINTLASMSVAEISAFDAHLGELMHESYVGELWSIVAIMRGGCSNDAFDYFRGWLFLQGKELFTKVVKNPTKLPELVKRGQFISCEAMLGVARAAYKAKTGDWDMPYDGPRGPGELKGELIADEEERKKKYSTIWRKYWDKF